MMKLVDSRTTNKWPTCKNQTKKNTKKKRDSRKFEKWIELPDEMKKAVIERLEYETRCNLRQCSKSDQSIVDNTSMTVSRVAIGERFFRKNRYRLSICVDETRWERVKERPTSKDEKLVVDRFLRIFNCRKSLVKDVFFCLTDRDTPNTFINALISEANSREIKIRAEQVRINCPKNTPPEWIFDLLKIFEAGFLNHIKLDSLTQNIYSGVVNIDQWKQCKTFDLREIFYPKLLPRPDGLVDINLKCLSHAEQFFLSVHQFSFEDLQKLIENFQLTPRPLGSHFFIRPDVLFDLDPILQHYGSQPRNELFNEQYEFYEFQFTQQFQVANCEFVLLIGVGYNKIVGCICRRNFATLDFMEVFDDKYIFAHM